MKDDVKIDSKYDDEIDLRELFEAVWVGKIKIIAITALFAVASVIYALSIPSEYRAESLLVPAKAGSGGISGALGQLGGLASLAGVSLPKSESSEVEIAVHIMKSRGFISKFVSDNGLTAEVYAVAGWDEDNNKLLFNEDLYDADSKKWLSDKGSPSDYDLYVAFSQKADIAEDKMTGLVTVTVDSFSPHLAKSWLDLYIAEINQHMQQRKVTKVSRNIKYLEMQLEKTEMKKMQDVLYSIIEEQIKDKMVTEASPDYVFVPTGPSMKPHFKFRPKRAMISIWGTTLGGILSVLFVLGGHFLRKSKSVSR